MNPREWCLKHKMTTAAFIRKAQEIAPRYTKVQHSMCSNAEYGVTVLPAVAAHIRGRDRHRLKRRVTFRLSDANAEKLERAKTLLNFNTTQEFMAFFFARFMSELDAYLEEK